MTVNKKYKDSLFRRYMNNKRRLLQLYNALERPSLTSTKEIKLTTLNGVFFDSLKNDISFQAGSHTIILLEHQSTVNPNMPLRMLFYISQLYRKVIDKKLIYGDSLIKIPLPKFYVFYNGQDKMPEHKTLKLSDAFIDADGKTVNLELTVEVYNINYSPDISLLQLCPALSEYSQFIAAVNKNKAAGQELDTAIANAINYCIEKNIMSDFLPEYREEVYNMVSYKWDINEAKEVWQEEAEARGYADGMAKGMAKGNADGIIKGKLDTLKSLVKEGLISLSVAAKKAGMTEEAFKKAACL